MSESTHLKSAASPRYLVIQKIDSRSLESESHLYGFTNQDFSTYVKASKDADPSLRAELFVSCYGEYGMLGSYDEQLLDLDLDALDGLIKLLEVTRDEARGYVADRACERERQADHD